MHKLYENGTIREMTAEEVAQLEADSTEMDDKLQSEIESLKAELARTDYVFIKIKECELLGEAEPYSLEYLEQLHQTRQDLRDKINMLEERE